MVETSSDGGTQMDIWSSGAGDVGAVSTADGQPFDASSLDATRGWSRRSALRLVGPQAGA